MNTRHQRAKPGRRWIFGSAAGLVLAVVLAGCGDFLDVENPNALIEEDILVPAAQGALVNGTLSTVARGVVGGFGDSGNRLLALSTASDEFTWVGSRDAWRELDFGTLSNPANEFTNPAWSTVTEGRWMADRTIDILADHEAEGLLESQTLKARALLYGGIIYNAIGEAYDDFVISDRMEPGNPIGEGNMDSIYRQAIDYLDEALAAARADGNRSLELTILMERAKSKHALGVWNKLNPKPGGPLSPLSDPLVNDPGAVQDAQAALALAQSLGEPNFRFRFQFSAGTLTNFMATWVNERLEHRVGDRYIEPTADDKRVARVTLEDPVDGIVDPVLEDIILEFVGARDLSPHTVVSAREMHLILAEAALAQGDEGGFATHINNLRALNEELSPWDGQIPAQEMLIHARQTNLFAQGRRLADMYRFGIRSDMWIDASDAVQNPGTFLPISETEREANPNVS